MNLREFSMRMSSVAAASVLAALMSFAPPAQAQSTPTLATIEGPSLGSVREEYTRYRSHAYRGKHRVYRYARPHGRYNPAGAAIAGAALGIMGSVAAHAARPRYYERYPAYGACDPYYGC
jgi:hypothetical protein